MSQDAPHVARPLRGLDHGEPPAALREQEERIAELTQPAQKHVPVVPSVADKSVKVRQAEIEAPTDDDPAGAAAEPQTEAGPARPVFTRQEKVELAYIPERAEFPTFRLTFQVGEVCFRENYVSMLIVSDLGFKPTATMKFDMTYKGKVTPVVFAGAEFEFQTVGIRGISFLIDKQRSKSQ